MKRFLTQHKVPLIGPIMDLLSYTAVWIGWLNFVMVAVTAYNTTLRPYLLVYIPWMKLWIFMLFLFCTFVLVILLVYKFIVPSYYEFRGQQYQQHGNMNTKMDDILSRITELEKKVEVRKETQ